MRFFGGSVPTGDNSPCWIPEGAVWALRKQTACLWTAKTQEVVQLATSRDGDRWAAVIGTHRLTRAGVLGWLESGGVPLPPPWPGTYTTVLGDDSGVTVFSDPVHAAPIYYTKTPEGAVWASSSYALSGLLDSKISAAWVSGLVSGPAGFAPADRCAFDGISMLAPGHLLELRVGRPPMVRPWWTESKKARVRTAITDFRRSLEDCVEIRAACDGTVSSDLSGGLDSTSLCLLAARRMGAGRHLIASTVRPQRVDHGGDLDYARAAVAGRKEIEHLVIALGDDAAPYSGMDLAPATDEPAPSTITAARHLQAYEMLASAGSVSHLTGDGGDALLMQSPEHVGRLAKAGHPIRALVHVHVHGWAKLNRGGPFRLLADMIGFGQARPDHRPWVTSRAAQYAEELTARGRIRGSSTDAEMDAVRGIGRTARADAQFADHVGIRLEAPFLDRRVVEAALRFPLAERGSPWSYKPQLTTALDDVLPASVLRRRTKGGTDADHHQGLRANLTSVLGLLDGWLAGNGLVDPQVLRGELTAAAHGKPTAWGLLEPVIATEVWARAVERTPPPRWFLVPEQDEVRT